VFFFFLEMSLIVSSDLQINREKRIVLMNMRVVLPEIRYFEALKERSLSK